MADGRTKHAKPKDSITLPLFPQFPEGTERRIVHRYKRLREPIWTENKARFIERYLYYFVQVTKHGTYIDGFAGPQWPEKLDCWAAKLVLESEPRWLRHVHLCELNKNKLKLLYELRAGQPTRDKRGRKISRDIEVYPGDFNTTVRAILKDLSTTEATFCLLDQHTFECDWATVVKLADHKREHGNKIELFYFLAVGWMHRAFSGLKGQEKGRKWWGLDDWRSLRKKDSQEIASVFKERFENELGYRYVAAYPIFERRGSDHIMYYMIHGSDHDEAPKLMVRAYNRAVRPAKTSEQGKFEFTGSEAAKPIGG